MRVPNFNGDVSEWDVSNVTNMSGLFKGSNFNGDISKWNVSNVNKDICHMFSYSEDMSGWFKGSNFNGDISDWNVSNVTTMAGMSHILNLMEILVSGM